MTTLDLISFLFSQYHRNVVIIFAICFATYFVMKKMGVLEPLAKRHFTQILLHTFPSSIQELPKFGMLRMIFGVMLLWRVFYQWTYLLDSDAANGLYMFGMIVTTVVYAMIATGFMTNIALMAGIFFYFGEGMLRAGTLGNDVAAILSLTLLLSHSWRTYSVDALIAEKCPAWPRLSLNTLFSLGERLVPVQISRAKFVAAACYWCLCIYSCLRHFGSYEWMSGDASVLLLTSSYLMKHYHFFQELLSIRLFENFFRCAMLLMFPWYMIFLPAFFTKGGLQRFNVIWWFFFLVLSTFALQLSFLGWFEFVFFAALLWTPRRSGKKPVTFYYDGKCNLCAKTVKIVRMLDTRRIVYFVSAQNAAGELLGHGITQEMALSLLVGRYDGKTYIGYDLYCLVARKVPLLWPVLPLLLLGKWTGAGYPLYRRIADNRISLFGSCSLRTVMRLPLLRLPSCRASMLMFLSLNTTVLFLVGVFMINPPLYPAGMDMGQTHYARIFGSLYRTGNVFGISQIDVFNLSDLAMSTHWRTIEYCPQGGACTLVPLTGREGERLAYHKSDSLYFGGTLRWRRMHVLDKDVCDYGGETFFQTEYLDQIARLYLRKNDLKAGDFKLTYYYQPLPDFSVRPWRKYWARPKIVCTRQLQISRP